MIESPPALQSKFGIPETLYLITRLSLLLFLMGKKSNKRIHPCDAENSLLLPISVAWAKTRWMQRLAWGRGSDMVYSSRRCIDLDPLKQFAPVIHGNRKGQGRIAMGSPPPVKVVHPAFDTSLSILHPNFSKQPIYFLTQAKNSGT